MKQEIFSRIRDWVEPAHPAIIGRYEDLVSIYGLIRDKYQARIDKAFDEIARQIGFVVATTIPVAMEISDKGLKLKMGAEHLQGTLFEKQFTAILSESDVLSALKEKHVRAGTYAFYLIWFDALRLRLRTDWLEPAHFQRARIQDILQKSGIELETPQPVKIRPEVQEPAHWFDPGILMDVEDAMLISALDEVYPELRLADRVASYRQAFLKVSPDVQEPAHFRKGEQFGGKA